MTETKPTLSTRKRKEFDALTRHLDPTRVQGLLEGTGESTRRRLSATDLAQLVERLYHGKTEIGEKPVAIHPRLARANRFFHSVSNFFAESARRACICWDVIRSGEAKGAIA